jgi:hypothetical protein
MQSKDKLPLSASGAEPENSARTGNWKVFPHKPASRPDKAARQRRADSSEADSESQESQPRVKHIVFPIKSASRDWRSGMDDSAPYLTLVSETDVDAKEKTPRSLRALRARSNTARITSRAGAAPADDPSGYRAFGEVKSLEEWVKDKRCPLSLTELQHCVETGESIEDAIVVARIATYNQFGVAVGETSRFRKEP